MSGREERMEMRLCLKEVKKVVTVLLAGGVIGILLLMLAYSIPVDRMLTNARASIEIFEKEGAFPQTVPGYKATTLDNYTDAWMLRNAFYDGEESAFQKCLHVYYDGYHSEQISNVCESMIAYLNGMEGAERHSYARYWHGYLILLKPLLYFFDYGDIREILKLTELSLLVWLCILFERKKMTRFLPALAVTLFCTGFHEIGQSMQYSWVFLIALTALIYLLKRYPAIDGKLFFLITGMCTSYFDFLTYPLFTLGMPLVVLLLLKSESEEGGTIKAVIQSSVFWGIGYFGFWMEKWILCNLLTKENIIADALQAISERVGRSVFEEPIGYVETVLENIGILCKYPYVLAVFGAVVLTFMGLRKSRLNFAKEMLAGYLLIAVYPLIWYAVAMNHSYVHADMTYRALGISIFSVLCMMESVKKKRLCATGGVIESMKENNGNGQKET